LTLSVRPYAADDAAALWAMLKPVFRAGDTYAVNRDISKEDALEFWLGSGHAVFVAEDRDVLGTYFVCPNKAGGGGHVANAAYVTAAGFGGKGVARAMLVHSLDTARAMGFRAMQYNFVVSTNTRAVDTWLRAGFEVVGRVPGAFNHPDHGYVDAFVMHKPLVSDGD